MNFLDPAVLARELTRAGLKVVTAGFCPYTAGHSTTREHRGCRNAEQVSHFTCAGRRIYSSAALLMVNFRYRYAAFGTISRPGPRSKRGAEPAKARLNELVTNAAGAIARRLENVPTGRSSRVLNGEGSLGG
jgi:hypothetical protein